MKRMALLLILIGAIIQTVSAKIVTLQEGVNGYSGCSDTYLYNREMNAAHGGQKKLTITDCPG